MKNIVIVLVTFGVPFAASAAVEFDYVWEELIGELTSNPDGYEDGCGELSGEYTFGTIRCIDLEGDVFAQTGTIYIYPEDEGVDFTIEAGGFSDSRNNLPAGGWSKISYDFEVTPPPGDVVLRFGDLETFVRVDELVSDTFHESFNGMMIKIKPKSLGQVKTIFN